MRLALGFLFLAVVAAFAVATIYATRGVLARRAALAAKHRRQREWDRLTPEQRERITESRQWQDEFDHPLESPSGQTRKET